MAGARPWWEVDEATIREAGFEWPPEDLPRRCLDTTEDGLVDLRGTLELVVGEAREAERKYRNGMAFVASNRGGMSGHEASRWKGSYDGDLERAADLRRAAEVVQQIRGAMRERTGDQPDDFYLALERHLSRRFGLNELLQVMSVAKSGDLANKTPEQRRSHLDMCADHWGMDAMFDPPGSPAQRVCDAFDEAIRWCHRRGPG